MIHSIDVLDQNPEEVIIRTMISSGSKANLRPEELVGLYLILRVHLLIWSFSYKFIVSIYTFPKMVVG